MIASWSAEVVAALRKRRSFFFGLFLSSCAIVMAIVMVEAFVRFFVDRKVILVSTWNRNNPVVTVKLPARTYAGLSESVRQNLEGLFLMQADPQYIFRVSPKAKLMNCHTGINAEGFRDRESFNFKKRTGKVILVLGDSCYFGLGICREEDTIGPALARALRARGSVFTVFNLSQPGFSTEQGKRLLGEWLPKLKPDILVVGLGWNDLYSSHYSDRQILEDLSSPPFYLFALLRSRWKSAQGQLDGHRVNPSESAENLQEIKSQATAAGARTIVMPLVRAPRAVSWLPDPLVFNSLLPEDPIAKKFTARFRQDHFRADGFHPNAEGVRLIAEWISDRILKDSP